MLSQFPTQFVKGSSRRTDIQLTHPYKNLSEFLGRYKQSNGSETVVELRNGFLHSSDIKLYLPGRTASLNYRFFGDACFMRDEAGKIKEIKWKGYGFDFTWVKQ